MPTEALVRVTKSPTKSLRLIFRHQLLKVRKHDKGDIYQDEILFLKLSHCVVDSSDCWVCRPNLEQI